MIHQKNCAKRTADEEEAAAAEAIADNGGDATPVPQPQTKIQLELSQPPLSETGDSQQVSPTPVRPLKFPPKKELSKATKSTSRSSNPSASTLLVVTHQLALN
ncbi:hypothetical protein Ahy_A10g050326 [Arachis hypogaea]|uniref:Uncharacterized protein n=1 Tax=Arachis hypogaea TaxID=3818 RepID=A0A445B969_ARAHY|nr:hypothetical protein Ahy_A10g050326 [Arachis hypogaea]